MSPKKYPALSERALSSGAGPGPMNETKPIALNCCSFEGKKRREGKKIKKKGKIKKENKRAGLKVKHSVFCCCFEVLYHKSNVSCLPLPQHISGDTFSAEPFKRKVFCFVSDEVGHQGYLFIFETDVNSGEMNP